MFGRQKIAALVAEFVGTAVLCMAVLAMAGRTSFPFFAAVIAGVTMGLMVLVFGHVSGAHLNPIVTLGLWTRRQMQTAQTVVFVAVQMLGGVAGWQVSELLLNQPLRNNAGGGFDWRVFAAEAIGGFIFTTAIAAALNRAYDSTRLAFVTGAGYTLALLVASLASNGVVNPALAVGIQSWNWSYVLGPVLGAVIGMNVYSILFMPEVANKRQGLRALVSRNSTTKVRSSSSKTKTTKTGRAKKRK